MLLHGLSSFDGSTMSSHLALSAPFLAAALLWRLSAVSAAVSQPVGKKKN
jgi:hypothetical protein